MLKTTCPPLVFEKLETTSLFSTVVDEDDAGVEALEFIYDSSLEEDRCIGSPILERRCSDIEEESWRVT